MYLPPPRRPSAFLKGAVARLYAAAESFERGTLEMERNVRATGRVHGHGGAGPGLGRSPPRCAGALAPETGSAGLSRRVSRETAATSSVASRLTRPERGPPS